MKEWKPVVGWEGIYAVSSEGDVKSLAKEVMRGNRWGSTTTRIDPERILRPCLQRRGYKYVTLQDGDRKQGIPWARAS